MVGAHLPMRVETVHPVVTDQRVLQRVLEGMAHVQRTGHIRRRQHDGVCRTLTGGREATGVFPVGVPFAFELAGVETFIHDG